jgi:hypothetical protein
MFDNGGYCYKDRSKLAKAWRTHYDNMGLAYNKREKKVIERVRRGKMPN